MKSFLIALLTVAAQAHAAISTDCNTEPKSNFVAASEQRLDRIERQLEEWKADFSNTADDITWRNASDMELVVRDLRGDIDRIKGSCSAGWLREKDYFDEKVSAVTRDLSTLRSAR